MNKAIFIDRDGTLIKDIPYNTNPALIEFNAYAIETLALLKQKNFLLILISNQSGVARGFVTIDELEKMHQSIQEKLSKHKAGLDKIYYCPHHPEGKIKALSCECNCRKPKPGLILQAAKEFDIDLSISWMIGDILNDVEAGNTAGCKTILLDIGNETEWILKEKRMPSFTARNWKEIKSAVLHNKVVLTDG